MNTNKRNKLRKKTRPNKEQHNPLLIKRPQNVAFFATPTNFISQIVSECLVTLSTDKPNTLLEFKLVEENNIASFCEMNEIPSVESLHRGRDQGKHEGLWE